MKRIFLMLLAAMLCLSFLSGCGNLRYKGPLSCISHVEADGQTELMDMTEDAQKTILSMLNERKWVNNIPNCGHDYEFTTQNATIRYHSECGTFIDVTNGRSRVLSGTDKQHINALLSE